MPANPKVLFIHNTIVWYRKPFFETFLKEIPNTKIVLTKLQRIEEAYYKAVGKEINNLRPIVLKNYFKLALGLIPVLLKEDYDIVIDANWDSLAELVETVISFLITKLRGKKYVVWNNVRWGYPGRSKKMKLAEKLLVRWILRWSDAIIVAGKKSYEYMQELKAPMNKVYIIPNISIPEYKEANINVRERHNIPENAKIVLYLGRLINWKGVDYLIRAFKMLEEEVQDVYLLIAGTGPFENELKKLAEELRVQRIRFAGFVEPEVRCEYFKQATVFVLPSVNLDGMAEPWGLVVNEAMYFGKPVIATNMVGASYELIKNGENGYIVPEKDPKALYEALKNILSSEENIKRMGEKSKEIIKDFTYENAVKKFKEILEKL